jgi:ubiquinone/menaquinone biosynthesis C-methylase UbiE
MIPAMKTLSFPIALLVGSMSLAAAAGQHQPGKPDHMEHRFDDPERYAKMFDDPARDAWQLPDRVVETLKLSPDASVADVGAGTGYFSVRLARSVPRGTVYAVDIEQSMLDYIKKRAASSGLSNIVTVRASGTSPNLPKAVDAVLIVDTYHHIPARDTYFRDLKKSLTARGRVVIIDFRKDSPEGPPPEFRFEADEIIDEMRAAGYSLEARHDFLPRQHFLVFTASSQPSAAPEL